MKKWNFINGLIFILLTNITLSKAQILDSLLVKNHFNHVQYLCQPTLEGRKTGEKGQYLAAKYIADFFKQNNLKTFENLPDSTPYYHDFYLYFTNFGKQDVKVNDTMKYNIGLLPIVNQHFIDSVPFKIKYSGTLEKNNLERFPFHEFVPILVVTEKIKPDDLALKLNNLTQKYGFKRFCVSFLQEIDHKQGLTYETMFKSTPRSAKRYEKELQKFNYLENFAKKLNPDLKPYYMPYYILGRQLKIEYNSFDKQIEKNNFYDTIDFKKQANYVNVNSFRKKDSLRTQNVTAYIAGKTDRNIIITAHYDHVGKQHNGTCLGADDNASGTSLIMQLAAYFSKQPQMNCNLVFIAFSGEEMGLLGSDFYVNHPLLALEKTVAVLNFDMVGRPDKHTQPFVHAVFSGRKERVIKKPVKKSAREMSEFQLDLRPGLKERLVYHFASDHFSFTRKKITNAVFFTDDHNDYHTPTDTPDKIDYENMAQIELFIRSVVSKIDEKTAR